MPEPEPEPEPDQQKMQPLKQLATARRIGRPMSSSSSSAFAAAATAGHVRCALCGHHVEENELRCQSCGTRPSRAAPAASVSVKPKKEKKTKKEKGARRALRKGSQAKAQPQQRDGVTGHDDAVAARFRESSDYDSADALALAEGHALCLLEELAQRSTWPTTGVGWSELLEEVIGVAPADEPWVGQLAEGFAGWLEAPAASAAGGDLEEMYAQAGDPWAEVPGAGVLVGPGTSGLGVLSDDGEWRWCVAVELPQSTPGSAEEPTAAGSAGPEGKDKGDILVMFTDSMGLGKRQWLTRDEFRPEWTLACEDDEEGKCEMCKREMPLTFHHLIPKETWSWVRIAI